MLLPLIALGLATLFNLPPVFFIGLVLIACCPGGSSSNVFSKLAGGDVALSVTLTALILVAIGCSSLLSRLVRTGDRQRRTVIIEVGMQNAAQAIAIASSPIIFANEEMAIPAILYSLMMNIVLLIYVGAVRRGPGPRAARRRDNRH